MLILTIIKHVKPTISPMFSNIPVKEKITSQTLRLYLKINSNLKLQAYHKNKHSF